MRSGTARLRGFSTLGCHDASAREVAALARRHDCDMVELRAHPDGPVHVGMSGVECDEWVRALADAGVRPACVASYVALADPSRDTQRVVEDGRAHVALAEGLGAPGVRVFAGGPGDAGTAERTRIRLEALLRATEESDVGIWLETHDRLPRGADVAGVLAGLPGRAAAVWDVVNPWRFGEAPLDTARLLAGRIALVQIKDVASPHDLKPVLPSCGTVPLPELLAALAGKGWPGPVSLEWERAWFPEIPPLDEALPAARDWLASSAREPDHRSNHA